MIKTYPIIYLVNKYVCSMKYISAALLFFTLLLGVFLPQQVLAGHNAATQQLLYYASSMSKDEATR
jgi:hypothetical protein